MTERSTSFDDPDRPCIARELSVERDALPDADDRGIMAAEIQSIQEKYFHAQSSDLRNEMDDLLHLMGHDWFTHGLNAAEDPQPQEHPNAPTSELGTKAT